MTTICAYAGCQQPFTPTPHTAPQGRKMRYCSLGCSRKAAAARRTARLYREDMARLDGVAPETSHRRSMAWWIAQADQITGSCAKCEGLIVGAYIPPTQETMGECAVVAHCRLCGAERLVIAGRGGVPYDMTTPVLSEAERIAQEQRSALGRAAVMHRVFRPPRVAGGQGKTRDNKDRWRERDARREPREGV